MPRRVVELPADCLLQLMQVQLHGLLNQPALNGIPGHIVGFDRERGRYTVRAAARALLPFLLHWQPGALACCLRWCASLQMKEWPPPP